MRTAIITTRAVPALLPAHHRRVATRPRSAPEMTLPTPWVFWACSGQCAGQTRNLFRPGRVCQGCGDPVDVAADQLTAGVVGRIHLGQHQADDRRVARSSGGTVTAVPRVSPSPWCG